MSKQNKKSLALHQNALAVAVLGVVLALYIAATHATLWGGLAVFAVTSLVAVLLNRVLLARK